METNRLRWVTWLCCDAYLRRRGEHTMAHAVADDDEKTLCGFKVQDTAKEAADDCLRCGMCKAIVAREAR